MSGKPFEPGEIPDGFYLCGDEENPQSDFQNAVNRGGRSDPHRPERCQRARSSAPPVVAPGVILYDYKALACAPE